MANLFESRAGEMVLRSYLAAKGGEETTRQAKANDRLSIYHDDWQDILERILASQFQPENYSKIRLLKNTTQNILKKVINDVSVVYKVAPTRDYGKSDVLDEIYDYLNINEFMRRANRYGTLLNDDLIRVGWDRELEQITLDLNTPANTSVIQREDYPEQAAAIYYDYEEVDTKFSIRKWKVYWSDFEHFLFEEEASKTGGPAMISLKQPAEDNPDMLNPYGKMPFVIVHMNQLPSMFWNPNGGADLVDGTTITGVKRTMKDYLFKHASFKQPVIVSEDFSKIADKLLLDPATAWKVSGQNASVTLLDFTAAFDQLDRTLQSDINSFLATYGLSIDMFATSGEEASGKALNIKNRGLREIRETQLPIFRRVEGELFEMIRTVYNTYNKKGIPESLKFKIDFAELETYLEPMEKRKQAQDDVKNGLISPGQYYMQFNPDITDEVEAEKAMTANLLKYKNMKNQGFSFEEFVDVRSKLQDDQSQLAPGNISGANMFGTKGNAK